MLGKIWKKVLFFILIIACIFNITTKLVHKSSLEKKNCYLQHNICNN